MLENILCYPNTIWYNHSQLMSINVYYKINSIILAKNIKLTLNINITKHLIIQIQIYKHININNIT